MQLASLKTKSQAFPGGSLVKNPPANAGDTGSVPGLGRFHMPRSNEASAPQLLSPGPGAQELQLLSPLCSRACALQKEKPPNEKPEHRN